jgi:hypothetical protein
MGVCRTRVHRGTDKFTCGSVEHECMEVRSDHGGYFKVYYRGLKALCGAVLWVDDDGKTMGG